MPKNYGKLLLLTLYILVILVMGSAKTAYASIGTPQVPRWETYYKDGVVQMEQGQLKEAERSLLLALQHVDENVSKTLATLEQLEKLYEMCGNYEAEELVLKTHLKLLREYRASSIYVASVYNRFAEVYSSMGRPLDAEKYYELALPTMKTYLGAQSLEVGLTLNNIAYSELEQKKYADAEMHFRQSLYILGLATGEKSIFYGLTANNLAELYEFLNRKQSAIVWYKRALSAFSETLGKEHPLTLYTEEMINTLGRGNQKKLPAPSSPAPSRPKFLQPKRVPPDVA